MKDDPKATPPVAGPPDVLRQTFQVQAPQFSIDPKNINTFYPPSGHQDEGRILPHIVFNDPHVPWLREAGIAYNFCNDPIDPDPTRGSVGRNLVPWMALVVFDPEELVITQTDAIAIGLMDGTTFKSNIASYVPDKLPSNGAFQMMVQEYFQTIPNHRIFYEAGYPKDAKGQEPQDLTDLRTSTDMTNVIFPTKALIKTMFGAKETPDLVAGESDRIFEGQKLMAHVRHVNTMGFPDAGVEEEGFFSVVVSSRTGSVHNNVPKTQVVHLVSLEHYDSSLINPDAPFRTLQDTDRVGMISLFSWTYTVVPAAVNFVDTMAAIAGDMQTLKPPQVTLDGMKTIINPPTNPPPKDPPKPSVQKAAQLLHDRLDLSYTISRWRTATGEETVAFNRGPLVSAPTPICPAKDGSSWPKLSMTGKDYQIFDRDIGVMDLTYSSAWSLGKLAAISDSPFNAALLRFRSLVWTKAASNTRLLTNSITSPVVALANAASAIDSARISSTVFSGVVSRLNPTSEDAIAPPLSDPAVAPVMTKAIQLAVDRYASTVDGSSLYNDFQLAKAANSDWELIHGWISDTLYLAHIPAHYLFPEPSHLRAGPEPGKPTTPNLPPEALRFFYVDHSWLDAFIDGALSCANHLEPDYDSTRLRIKEVYNFYLKDYIAGLEEVSPPVPQFGFVFRSSVVKAIPDLKILVKCWLWDGSKYIVDNSKLPRNPVVRLTKLDDFTILCLLDCSPEEIQEIKISQPPHQQRYAMGYYLGPNTLDAVITPEMQLRILYTDKSKAPEATGEDGEWKMLPGKEQLNLPEKERVPIEQPTDAEQATFWNDKNRNRCINPIAIADVAKTRLNNSTAFPNVYKDDFSTSALIGLELSDPAHALTIKVFDKDHSEIAPKRDTPFPKFVRQLWTGILPDPPAHETDGVLTEDMLPSDPLVKTTAVDPTKITLAPVDPASKIPDLPTAPRFNSSAIINTAPFKVTATPGGGQIPAPQFTLLFHVDYRVPPPTPTLKTEVTYAPLDYLPTDTDYLYDVIIAIRRINHNTSPNYLLSDLSVEIPISDGVDAADPRTRQVREPLLPVGGYHGPGVRMVNNPRFVPTLYNTQDAAGKPILGIRLIPRSGRADATIPLTDKAGTNDLSVRLAEVEVAKIKQGINVAVVQATKDGKATNPPSVVKEKRGVVKLRLVERYVMSDGKVVTMITDGDTKPIPLVCLKKDSVSE